METRALIIFIKNPKLGKVKTRIAETAGDHRALEIYQELLSHTQKVTLEVAVDRYLYYAATITDDDMWSSEQFVKRVQSAGDIGDRMSNAILECENTDKVILIGSDCASITPKHIESAYAELEDHDVVLGPTYDGGYYLIGMKKSCHEIFDGVDWSTEKVLSQSIEKIQAENLTYGLIEKLSDIDYLEDWEKWGW